MKSNAHILILEDQAEMADTAAEMLRGHGYEVSLAATAEDALAAMADEQRPIDVIVLDLNLAGARGETLIHRSETLHLPQPAIVITSAEPRTECASALLELGASGCLIKPYSMTDLLTEVGWALHATTPHLV